MVVVRWYLQAGGHARQVAEVVAPENGTAIVASKI
jgi:hypothetical protein